MVGLRGLVPPYFQRLTLIDRNGEVAEAVGIIGKFGQVA